MIDDSTVRDALRMVMDPEAGMNIVDLGLVYGIEISPEMGIRVDLTMTSGACPMAEMICDEARVAIENSVPRGTPVEIELVWDPPWTPDKMSDLARDQFGWLPK